MDASYIKLPITHGAFTRVWALFDPEGFFPRLRQTTLAQPDSAFRHAIQALIVGEIYEILGKIRNTYTTKNFAPLPAYALELARYEALLGGLWNHFLFTSSSLLWQESLALPDNPESFELLCKAVMNGKLNQPRSLLEMANQCWEGVEKWAAIRDIPIYQELEELLPNC